MGGTFGALPQAPLRGIPPQTPIFASWLSSDTGRFNQGSLRSLIVVFLCFAWGYVWGAAPSPAEGDSPSDSHLRFAVIVRCRAFQSGIASLPDCRFLCFVWGYVWGTAPSPAEGDSPSDSHLRFAVIARCRAFQSGIALLPDCRFFMLRMGLRLGRRPKPR